MSNLIDLISLVYPRKCILCCQFLKQDEKDICHKCRTEIPLVSKSTEGLDGIDEWTALWVYDGIVRDAILRYKFKRMRSYGKSFSKLLAQKIEQDFGRSFDVIVYVPVRFSRNVERSYDQVQVIAKSMAKHFGMKPYKAIRKIRRTATQSTLKGSEERERNVKDAYRVIDPELVDGKRVLLLDDIITTGSTVKECAKILRAAGAKKVLCAAVAVTQGRNR